MKKKHFIFILTGIMAIWFLTNCKSPVSEATRGEEPGQDKVNTPDELNQDLDQFQRELEERSDCSAFIAADGQEVYMGGNTDDYPRLDAECYAVPSVNGKYGHIILNTLRDYYLPMNGMNEEGLFFDMAGTPQNLWKASPEKKNYNGYLHEKMLQDCATVKDAVKLYSEYNAPHLQWGHIMVVDSTGDSVIIEWDSDNDNVAFIRKEQGEKYQLMTNFFLLHPELGAWPCQRYERAKEMLDNTENYNWEFFRQVHIEALQQSSTTYTTIAAPVTRNVYVFFLHNYEEYAIFNVFEELNSPSVGQHTIFTDLFAKLHIISPKQGETIHPGSVTLRWVGMNDKTYEVLYSRDANELDSVSPMLLYTEIMEPDQFSNLIIISLLLLTSGFFIFYMHMKEKRIVFAGIFLVLSFLLLPSCNPVDIQDDPDNPKKQTYSFTIDNLDSSSTYYWKIRSTNTSARTTESVIYSFNTI
jgi:hypothetical protein